MRVANVVQPARFLLRLLLLSPLALPESDVPYISMLDLSAYLGLFGAAFAAATLVPAQSEAVLVGLLLHGSQPAAALLLVATVGNVLGSLVNWLLGRSVERLRHKRWFPVSDQQLERAQRRYHRYGRW